MTKVINIASLTATPKVIIKMPDGTDHPMKHVSVADFAENIALVEKMGMNASVADEIKFMIEVVERSFPTMDNAIIKSLPFEALQEISEHARGQSGAEATMDADKASEAEASGNASKAT